MMDINKIEDLLEGLEVAEAPFEEIQLLRTLKAENEWMLLSANVKQEKRKAAVSYIERLSEDNIPDLSYEKNIIELYDMGNEILESIKVLDQKDQLVIRLRTWITIEQFFINEFSAGRLRRKMRMLDLNLAGKLFNEINEKEIEIYQRLSLDCYLMKLNEIWEFRISKH